MSDHHEESSRGVGGRSGRGIQMHGAGSFNNKLVTRLSCAPADLMVFLEAALHSQLNDSERLFVSVIESNHLNWYRI